MSRRRVGHQRETKEKQELEQENRKLKREVARLRKQIDQEGLAPDEDEIEEEQKTVKCPSCHSVNVASITTPSGKVRFTCRACNWRGPIQAIRYKGYE